MPSAEHQNVVDFLISMGIAQDTDTPVEQRRVGYELLGSANPLQPTVEVAPITCGGVPCEWVVDSASENSRVVVYLHGGGFCIGSLTSHRELAARISKAVGARVLTVEYRLAPESRFPAALDDCIAAYASLIDGGVDPRCVTIAGDSAGGGLTISMLQRLMTSGDELPSSAVCLSPWVDLSQSGSTIDANAGVDPVVSRAGLNEMADHYLEGGQRTDPLASPLFGNLHGLPPLLIQVGTAEVLLDDSRRLANAARNAGVDVALEEYDGLIHVFQQMCPLAPEAHDAVSAIGRFVRDHGRDAEDR